MYIKRFSVSAGILESLSCEANLMILFLSSFGVNGVLKNSEELSASSERRYAIKPATWGEAIEVPEIVFVALVDPVHAERISLPGANTSTHLPKFENQARSSSMVEAPTVIAFSAAAGE